LTTYLNTEAEQFHAALALAEELPRDYRIQLAVCLMAFELSPADVKALMTSRIIYGVTLADALNKFLEDNSPALDIKKIEEFNNKTTNKNRAKLKY